MPDLKLLFIYLWTNDACNAAGLYEFDPELAEFQTKISLNGDTLTKLTPAVEYFPESGHIWIKNFFRRQCKNRSFAYAACKALRKIPPDISRAWYTYNAKTLKSHGLNTQWGDGGPIVLPQTIKQTRSVSKYSKGGSTDLLNGEEQAKDACPQCGKAKREPWHDLCDECFKNKPQGRAQPSGKKPPPCKNCGHQYARGYTGMVDGLCLDCRQEIPE